MAFGSGKLVFFAILAKIFAVLATGTNDQVESNIDFGTFLNPSANLRPRFRYWIPDGSVDPQQVAEDVADVGRAGGGGVEVLGFFEYGGIGIYGKLIPTDWTKYGWGTQAWRELQDAALRSTKQNNLVIDFAIGGNQGAGVPAPYDDDGLQWDLQPFNISIPIGQGFNGLLPGWGAGKLVAATTGLVVQSTSSNRPSTAGGITTNTTITNAVLHADSLTDVTTLVGADGRLDLNLDASSTGQHYVLFAYYLVRSGYREIQTPPLLVGAPQSSVRNYVQNGSFVVDHFSSHGAETVAKFWKDHLLNNSDTVELLAEVGNYLWEDSQEFPANLDWTPNLPSTFAARRGYSILPYLPILFNGANENAVNGAPPVAAYYTTDASDHGRVHTDRYRQTLVELNAEYWAGLTDFAQSLGIQSSGQLGYNQPLDMLYLVPYVNAPELESLGFASNIDAYRQYSGPANLAGKRVISSECGARGQLAYQLTLPDLLWDVKRSIVGGVNNMVFHGLPYSGLYANTTWPGYTTFSYMYAEMHGRRQPGWDFYKEHLDFVARLQYVAQSGVPKIDLAFYQKRTSYQAVPQSYAPTDLQDAGYSYEYLTTESFGLPAATVSNNTFAPSVQAFKAIVVRSNETVTPDALTTFVQLASQGVTFVLEGGLPKNITFLDPTSSETVNAALSSLSSSKNVHIVPAHGLARSIAALGITARVSFQKNNSDSTWYSLFRQRSDSSETYVIIYNDATGLRLGRGASNGSVTVDATGVPYLYDAWTGAETSIGTYKQNGSTTTVPLTLAGNQTAIIVMKHNGSHLSGNYSTPFQHVGAPQTLNNWTLTIESWQAPSNLSNMLPTDTVKTNTTYKITALQPWNELEVSNLTYTSGRGYYHTKFSWPPSDTTRHTHGAIIDLGPVLHTAVVYINGQKTAPLDVTAAQADITDYLIQGSNDVDIIVSTPLGNALVPLWNQTLSGGNHARPTFWNGQPTYSLRKYGLVGEVVVRPYSYAAM